MNGLHPSTTQDPDDDPTPAWNLITMAETVDDPTDEATEVPRELVDAEEVDVPVLVPTE